MLTKENSYRIPFFDISYVYPEITNKWLNENIGEQGIAWVTDIEHNFSTMGHAYYFRTKEDLVAFKLKFS